MNTDLLPAVTDACCCVLGTYLLLRAGYRSAATCWIPICCPIYCLVVFSLPKK
ncbi:hypothetical protein SLEP1_g3118 [Rubroshorea leprosula]|uniref:Uncharacterized protein n=1 Tax=Rubroshorea leprosula TaxID=152421 RepID=A0AAV5HT25_9ROSI|nr:hypothetical protein SLEP1_g3118 [Rubroshorea leprosula]